jgi:hypothetical protein
MKSARVANVFFAVGIIAAIASFAAPDSAAKGWLCLAAFGSFAMHSFLAEWPGQPPWRGAMYGFYMLVAAVVLSSPYLWPAEPMWLKEAITGLFILTVVWILIEQKKSASVGGSFWAPLRVPPTRSRAVRLGVFVVIALALPPLFYWLRK